MFFYDMSLTATIAADKITPEVRGLLEDQTREDCWFENEDHTISVTIPAAFAESEAADLIGALVDQAIREGSFAIEYGS